MAGYALRYYKDYGVQDSIVRLEIFKRYKAPEFAPAPIEIGGVLSSARLVMQGDQDDVTVPIIKTSLELSLVDAPDTEYGRITGPWEEFYTPDSTEFYIKILIDGVVEWTGYVTPDSYEEDITAYGIVTITARDNIGHLQDFLFEENGNVDGMISVQDIFTKAWQLIESKQDLVIADEPDVIWPECYGYRPYELMLNVEAFQDKNWYEVIESVLDSFGLVLRYVGHNEFRIYPLRSLPLLDKPYFSFVGSQPILFKADGHRSLQRACKKIVDTLKYEIGDIYAFNLKDKDYSRASLLINGKTVDSWEPSSAALWRRVGNVGTMNPYEFGKNPRSGASFASQANLFMSVLNEVNADECLVLDRPFMAGELMMDLSFNFDGRFYSAGYNAEYINVGSAKEQTVEVFYSIECYTCDETCSHYWFDMENNKFVTEEKMASASLAYGQSSSQGRYGSQLAKVEHSVRIPSGTSMLQIKFYGFKASLIEQGASMRPSRTPIQDLIDAGKAYCRISDLKISQADAGDFKESRVISLYDEMNNNLITRDPALGAGPVVLSAKVIKNGIYLPESGYPPATPWNWPEEEVKTELQVLIAQQILLYNSKPNNLLTGTLVSDDKMLRLPGIWTYNNKNHILISGSLDLLTGYLEDVKLREYLRWPELYPDDFYLMTEDEANVLTEDSEKVIISAREYNLLMEDGHVFETEDNNNIILN